jgi:hypothetical protein
MVLLLLALAGLVSHHPSRALALLAVVVVAAVPIIRLVAALVAPAAVGKDGSRQPQIAQREAQILAAAAGAATTPDSVRLVVLVSSSSVSPTLTRPCSRMV